MTNDSRLWNISIVLIVFCTAMYMLAEALADPDVWGHTLFGLDILAEGSIPRVDPYSYLTDGVEWINHEWMTEILFGLSYRMAGGAGLALLKLTVSMTIFGLAFWQLVRRGLDPLRSGIVMLLIMLLLLPGLLTIRPQMFTFLGFLLVLLALEQAERGPTRWLWGLPVLMAVWVNFHGGVLAGVAIVWIWAAVRTLELVATRRSAAETNGLPGPWPGAAPAIGLALACGLATLLNPYGWELPAFLLRTGTVPRPDIVEWQPLGLTTPQGAVYLVLVLLGLVTLARSPRARRPAPLILLGIITLMPLIANRHLQLFALGYAVLMAEHLAGAWVRAPEDVERPGERSSRLRPALVASVALGGLVLAAASAPRAACIRITPDQSFPVPARAIGLIEDSGVRGNLAVFFDWGEYAIWHLQPDVKVGMDGRRETVYPDSIFADDLRFRSGLGRWDAVLDDRPTDMALANRHQPTFNLLELKPGWIRVYSDPLVGLFAREGSEIAARLRDTPVPDHLPFDGDGLCFP